MAVHCTLEKRTEIRRKRRRSEREEFEVPEVITCQQELKPQIELAMAPPISFESDQLPIKLLSTDFDGTLVGSKEGEQGLDQFFDMVVEQRERYQLQWVINTGRSWDSLCEELQNRDFPILPEWVVLAEREVHKVSHDHPVGDYEWNQRCDEVHARLFKGTTVFWAELSEFIRSQTGAEQVRDEHSPVTVRARNDREADRIHQFVSERLSFYPGLTLVRNSVYFRFAHEAYHKGSALQRIQDLLGLNAGQTMAIGDHYNDLPMLDPVYARSIACPVNAIPEVQAHVRAQRGFVSTLPQAAGVVEAWKSYLL